LCIFNNLRKFAPMSVKTKEVLFPERSAKIIEVSAVKSFTTREGDTMYGIEVTMDNGDHFSHWMFDKLKVQMFVPGTSMIYRLKKTIEGEGTAAEKIKVKLDTFDFILPRKVRAEMHVVDRLVNSISFSTSDAKDMLKTNPQWYTNAKGEIDFNKLAKLTSGISQVFHQNIKSMLLAEDFGDA
jgi:hypothetical protein